MSLSTSRRALHGFTFSTLYVDRALRKYFNLLLLSCLVVESVVLCRVFWRVLIAKSKLKCKDQSGTLLNLKMYFIFDIIDIL